MKQKHRNKTPYKARLKRSGPAQMSAYRQLHRIADVQTKNLIRGIIDTSSGHTPFADSINKLRARTRADELAIGAEIVLGKNGSSPFPNIGSTYRSLLVQHSLNSLDAEKECAFISGHLNGWHDEVVTIIKAMATFAKLPNGDPVDGMKALSVFVSAYGASSYIVRKIAYLIARHGEQYGFQDELDVIASKVKQSKYPGPYFLAMELIDTEFPYFSNVSTRVQIFSKYIGDDYRKILPLHDLVPVPLTETDVSAFLRKAHSCSLVDEISSFATIIGLEENFSGTVKAIKTYLHPEIFDALIGLVYSPSFSACSLYSDADPFDADLIYYRRSIAFVEFAKCAEYRFYNDTEIVPRIFHQFKAIETCSFSNQFALRDITKALIGFRNPDDYKRSQNSGIFLRTVNFLKFLSANRGALSLNLTQVRFICEHTNALDILMRESELENLYATSTDDALLLVNVLALALHKARNHDDDVDFKFRHALCQTVINQFGGKIEAFVEWLLPTTPQTANYMISVLDTTTLQKLYWIINSAEEADDARQALLRSVGKQRGELAYFIEADAIEASRQVSKLQKYFDDSRIYVDGLAMKAWLSTNPSAYRQQYLRIIEHSINVVTIMQGQGESNVVVSTAPVDSSTIIAFDYILIELAKVAFEQFCTNKEFGIESYLGRRIRHNTLTGMMRGGVEDLIELPQYRALTYDKRFIDANDRWIERYRSFLDSIRKDVLQFRSDTKSKGIFSADVRNDDNTLSNIASIRTVLSKTRSGDLLNELLIRFCWQEINPQLVAATKVITVDLLSEAYDLIEEELGTFNDDVHRQYKVQLRETVHERFTRLGSWFRQPQDGFVSATTKQLVDLIVVEITNGGFSGRQGITWTGDGADITMDGLSVHRMYDCLSVLLRNAHKNGSIDHPVSVRVDVHDISDNYARMLISVSSNFENEAEKRYHMPRLIQSFESADLCKAMSVEGYSGLRKLRYITYVSEGISTATYKIEDEICTVSFSLSVEKKKLDEVSL